MLFLADYNFPYIIDSVTAPVVPKHCWFYDSELNDMLLRPIRLLEETIGATVTVEINGFKFQVPASWNLLVVDEETKLIDTVPIAQCSSSNYKAFLTHPEESMYALSPIILHDLVMKGSCSHVMIPRMHMLLHPVGPIEDGKVDKIFSCLLSPQDIGKHMTGMTAMELIV